MVENRLLPETYSVSYIEVRFLEGAQTMPAISEDVPHRTRFVFYQNGGHDSRSDILWPETIYFPPSEQSRYGQGPL